MIVKKISFPTQLKYIENIEDDNIDVFVELEDGNTYTVVVATHRNILSQMDKAKSDFLEAGCPFIIVRMLTEEIIEKAIKSYAKEDAYWLKLNHLSTEFNINELNALINKLAE